MKFALTRFPSPVFNTPDFSTYFGSNTLPLDEQGLLRAVETILFPQTKVEILEKISPFVFKIRTEEYPYPGDHYIDARFVQFSDQTSPRIIQLPSKSSILARLKRQVGARYIWGGNWPEGIDLLPQLYPAQSPDSLTQDIRKLKGVDCTGLLYHATDGWTKRNSSSLIDFGVSIPIEGLSAKQITDLVKPLDIIVWKGHIIVILDKNTSIESKNPEGVVTCDLFTRLSQIMNGKKPVNDWNKTEGPRFVIRRWHKTV